VTLAVCGCPAGKRALKKVQPILGGFNREDYATQRLWTKVSLMPDSGALSKAEFLVEWWGETAA
jgi:hypothetical protein